MLHAHKTYTALLRITDAELGLFAKVTELIVCLLTPFQYYVCKHVKMKID